MCLKKCLVRHDHNIHSWQYTFQIGWINTSAYKTAWLAQSFKQPHNKFEKVINIITEKLFPLKEFLLILSNHNQMYHKGR